MPITPERPIRIFSQEEFKALDRRILRVVFDVHNHFGRFLEEELFKREIAARIAERRIGTVDREFRIRVTHKSFEKVYRIDLLVESGSLVEAKAVEALSPAHRAQAFNYLFLSGLQHGLLVNLGTELVQHEYVSTSLTSEARHQFHIVDTDWRPLSPAGEWLQRTMLELLHDWGAFLELQLYRDAITHFLGGKENVVRPVNVMSGDRVLGQQDIHLLSPNTAFALSAVTGDHVPMQRHLSRFLRHTPLEFIQWINFNHHQIEFRTLSRFDLLDEFLK
ncbi:MAG: GxxExxY protein [Planctomycetaceae bacterium]